MMRIEVTAEDIAQGQPKQARSCPIALAFLRATAETWAIIGRWATLSRHDHLARAALLPAEAQGFEDQFDDGLPCEPFAFDVNIEDLHEQ